MDNKKRQKVAKIILNSLLLAGGIAMAATSPFFLFNILSKASKNSFSGSNRRFSNGNSGFIDNKEKKRMQNSFYYLMRKNLLKMENKNGQVYISLTEEGKKKAGKYQIDDLEIKKPEKWDKIWRILIFDIKNEDKIKREALRGKIKELGLYQLQKSVWVYPYEFQKEIKLLRNFFGLDNQEMIIITASEIESDKKIKNFFKI